LINKYAMQPPKMIYQLLEECGFTDRQIKIGMGILILLAIIGLNVALWFSIIGYIRRSMLDYIYSILDIPIGIIIRLIF
jgi:hypothetical protein